MHFFVDDEHSDEEAIEEITEVRVEFDAFERNSHELITFRFIDTGSLVSFVRQLCVPDSVLYNRQLRQTIFAGFGNRKFYSFGQID